jgi:hypothetical protein
MGRINHAQERSQKLGNGHGRQLIGIFQGERIGPGHEQSAERGECLGVTKYTLAAARLGKQFGQPGHGRHEFDADTDKGRTPQYQQHLDRGGKTGQKRRHRVEQNAPGEHPAASQQVGQVAA